MNLILFAGIGGNLTVAGFVFAEAHVGIVGDDPDLEDVLELRLKD